MSQTRERNQSDAQVWPGTAMLRLVLVDGTVVRLPHVCWWRRLNHSDIEYEQIGKPVAVQGRVLKAEIFTDDL